MKKFATKLSVLLLISAFGAGMFSGCGGKKVENNENFLEIQFYERGYGSEGIQAVADRFMELHPEVTVYIDPVTDNTLATDIYSGPDIVTTDMYFNGGDNVFNLVNSGEVTFNGVTYPSYFEPLTEVYEYTPEGESLPIKDKMIDSYEEFYNMGNDVYYLMPWMGGYTGIVYNSKMFENYKWPIPRTTDELFEVCDMILATDAKSTNKNSLGESIEIVPFSFCLEDSYWEYVYLHWWAQYDGIEKFNAFFEGKMEDGTYSPEIAASTGRLEMLKVLDGILGTYELQGTEKVKRGNVYCDPTLATRSFIDTQSTFLNAEGARVNLNGATTSAMMPNGDWIENEMYANFADKIESGEVEFKMMKIPVISAIADKTSFKNAADADEKLRELIDYIDSGKQGTLPDFANENDVKIVEKARGIGSSVGQRYSVYVPAYATAKEIAKEFLKFMYLDEGIRLNTSASRGTNLPVNFDWSGVEGISDFQKSKFEVLASTTDYAFNSDKYAIKYRGGLSPFRIYTPVEAKFNVSSDKDYIDPQTIFIDNYNEFVRLWPTMMKDAGIEY